MPVNPTRHTPRCPRAYLALSLFIAATLFLSGCARGRRPRPAPPTAAPPAGAPAPIGYVEEGIASWYGHPYHGRRAAGGEIYNMYDMTAAHRTLPFNTWVNVTNFENGRTTRVRINDRGPFVEGRIIDLSLAAAQAIQMYVSGTARVRLEVTGLPPGASVENGNFAVQVGAFRDRRNAERLQQQLQARYGTVTISEYDSPQGLFHRVRVGAAHTREQAERLAEQLRSERFIPFVVRVD